MSKIRILEELVINQIAAGEVVENSASVVKELVENSLDAGASRIIVEIAGGGRQLIRVSDDGSGMSLEDARLSLQRHATSKLSSIDDLEALTTKGFRGEAIPSIASISKMTMITSNGEEGNLLVVEGGKKISETSAIRDNGTTIEIKSLFFNVPVRKKYQKSPSYDVRSIEKTVRHIALGHPYQGFQMLSDGKNHFTLHPQDKSIALNSAIARRIEEVMGKEFTELSYWIEAEDHHIVIRGFIGQPVLSKRNRLGQIVLINGRSVFAPLVAQAVKNGLGSMIQEGLHPVFCLFIELPLALIDVNVHPQKSQVRFCDEAQLRNAIAKAVYKAFHGKNLPFHDPQSFSSVEAEIPAPFVLFQPHQQNTSFASYSFDFKKDEEVQSEIQIPLPLLPSRPQIITLIKGYIVLDPQTLPKHWNPQVKEGLAFLDQRLAHQRILLESIESQEDISVISQVLLMPKIIEIGAEGCQVLKKHHALLKKMGIDLKFFGENTIVIEALPSSMNDEEASVLIFELTDELRGSSGKLMENSALKLLQSAALRRDHRLSFIEANHLLDALMLCQRPLLCPKGRSVIKIVGVKELEKW